MTMTTFTPINDAQQLLHQLSLAISHKNDIEIQSLLISLATQLDHIKTNTSSLQQQLTQLNGNAAAKKQASLITAKPEMKSGCYIFANEKGFFCPRCYDEHTNKVPTTRLNSKLRICPACRTSLK